MNGGWGNPNWLKYMCAMCMLYTCTLQLKQLVYACPVPATHTPRSLYLAPANTISDAIFINFSFVNTIKFNQNSERGFPLLESDQAWPSTVPCCNWDYGSVLHKIKKMEPVHSVHYFIILLLYSLSAWEAYINMNLEWLIIMRVRFSFYKRLRDQLCIFFNHCFYELHMIIITKSLLQNYGSNT